jgi:hypothetical protein
MLGAAALVVAIAVVFALAAAWQWRLTAQAAGDDVLDAAQAVQGELLQLHRDALLQISTALSANAGLAAYINRALGDAATPPDVHSIQDQLAQRRGELALDAMAVLLPSGQLVAAVGTDIPDSVELGRDERFLAALASSSATAGFLVIGARCWQVAFAPLNQGGVVVAVLMSARRHDAVAAREFAALSHAGYALVVPGEDHPRLAASSLDVDDAQALSQALATNPHWLGEPPGLPGYAAFGLAGFAAPVRVRPVADAIPGTAWLTIALPHSTAHVPRLFAALALALIGVLAALGVASWTLWRQWIGPLLALADVAERSVVGDHAIAFAPRGAAAVLRIGQALNRAQTQLGRYRPPPNSPRRRMTDRA